MTTFPAGADARTYAIGDLSDLFGISRRALRFYEERELLRPRRQGKQRVYSEDDRLRLEIILRAKRLGFSLAVIWQLMERHGKARGAETLSACRDGLALHEDEIRAQVARLTSERERVHRAIEELRAAAARHALKDDEPNPGRGSHHPDGY